MAFAWVGFIEDGPVYDFGPHGSIALFLSYAQSIGAVVQNLNKQHGSPPAGGVFGAGTGWIDFRLPPEFEQVQVRFRNVNDLGLVELYLGGVKMYTANPTSTVITRVMDYTYGDTLRILDSGNSVIHFNLIVTLSKNSSRCEPCVAGEFRTMEMDPIRCASCPLHASLTEGSSICECNVGRTMNVRNQCVLCEAGSHKIARGNHACSLCAAGKYKQ